MLRVKLGRSRPDSEWSALSLSTASPPAGTGRLSGDIEFVDISNQRSNSKRTSDGVPITFSFHHNDNDDGVGQEGVMERSVNDKKSGDGTGLRVWVPGGELQYH
jgi:hypothetical protein